MCKRNGIAHTNESQFYVTLGGPLPFLDNQCVVFGRVVSGFRVFRQIEKMDTNNEKPIPDVQISDAGPYKHENKKVLPRVNK
jgi:cyclophilin family peptidyl-prolyl cis-trans isomerase